MAEMDEYSSFSRYERRWFFIGAALLLVFLALMLWFTIAHRGIIPGPTKATKPTQLLSSNLFRHLGVHKVGPHHYNVVMTAQDFSFTPGVVTVPTGAKISFVVTSRDVIHGFQIPGTLVNLEAIPGRVGRVSHVFTRPGVYEFDCNQYCGVGHPFMRGHLKVVSAAKFTLAAAHAASGGNGQSQKPVDGKALFASHCAACHQSSGGGMPGAFPPLAGHVPNLVATTRGRHYLMEAVLFGVDGKISVKGQQYNGHMPAWGDSLSDRQLAGVLNYIATAWGNRKALPASFKAYTASELAHVRAHKLTPKQVRQDRAELKLSK